MSREVGWLPAEPGEKVRVEWVKPYVDEEGRTIVAHMIVPGPVVTIQLPRFVRTIRDLKATP
jgi:hypothetical protein